MLSVYAMCPESYCNAYPKIPLNTSECTKDGIQNAITLKGLLITRYRIMFVKNMISQ